MTAPFAAPDSSPETEGTTDAPRAASARRLGVTLLAALLLAACSSTGSNVRTATRTASILKGILQPEGGGYYQDDGPASAIPVDLDAVPDAVPKREPLHKAASKPYEVLGKRYVPQTELRPFRQEGVASWYGKKFHGQKTSIGDTYDMFAMSAAHPTLPLPSYARVTNPANGRAVVVRLNDRGPFHAGRIIDLSYTAAYKLGYVNDGSARVIVETIIPGGEPLPPVNTPTQNVATAAAVKILTPVAVSAVKNSVSPEAGDALDLLSQHLMAQTEPPVSASVQAADGIGVFLQLGAFSSAENAENMLAHLSRELDWLTDPLRIDRSGALHRLQLGPYADRASAERMARKIESILGFSPAIVQP